MAKEKIAETVYNIALPMANVLNLDIYEVEFKKEGSDKILRVILDTKPENDDTAHVSINDCETVSRELGEYLDKEDLIKEAYVLEVTSPGLDRPLKKSEDFLRFKGHCVDVGLYKAKDGSKVISGTLENYNNGDVTLTLLSGQECTLLKSEISSVKLSVIF